MYICILFRRHLLTKSMDVHFSIHKTYKPAQPYRAVTVKPTTKAHTSTEYSSFPLPPSIGVRLNS